MALSDRLEKNEIVYMLIKFESPGPADSEKRDHMVDICYHLSQRFSGRFTYLHFTKALEIPQRMYQSTTTQALSLAPSGHPADSVMVSSSMEQTTMSTVDQTLALTLEQQIFQ